MVELIQMELHTEFSFKIGLGWLLYLPRHLGFLLRLFLVTLEWCNHENTPQRALETQPETASLNISQHLSNHRALEKMFSDIKNVKEFSHSSSSDVSNHHAVLFHFRSWLNFVFKKMLENASHVKMLGNECVEQTDRVDQCHQWFCLFVAFVLHVRYAAVSAHGSAFAQVNCSKWHKRDLNVNVLQGWRPKRNEYSNSNSPP